MCPLFLLPQIAFLYAKKWMYESKVYMIIVKNKTKQYLH